MVKVQPGRSGTRGADVNRRPSGYGPDDLPLLSPTSGCVASCPMRACETPHQARDAAPSSQYTYQARENARRTAGGKLIQVPLIDLLHAALFPLAGLLGGRCFVRLLSGEVLTGVDVLSLPGSRGLSKRFHVTDLLWCPVFTEPIEQHPRSAYGTTIAEVCYSTTDTYYEDVVPVRRAHDDAEVLAARAAMDADGIGMRHTASHQTGVVCRPARRKAATRAENHSPTV
jgi:hypothetical protein